VPLGRTWPNGSGLRRPSGPKSTKRPWTPPYSHIGRDGLCWAQMGQNPTEAHPRSIRSMQFAGTLAVARHLWSAVFACAGMRPVATARSDQEPGLARVSARLGRSSTVITQAHRDTQARRAARGSARPGDHTHGIAVQVTARPLCWGALGLAATACTSPCKKKELHATKAGSQKRTTRRAVFGTETRRRRPTPRTSGDGGSKAKPWPWALGCAQPRRTCAPTCTKSSRCEGWFTEARGTARRRAHGTATHRGVALGSTKPKNNSTLNARERRAQRHGVAVVRVHNKDGAVRRPFMGKRHRTARSAA
jgi:hypothetical protein